MEKQLRGLVAELGTETAFHLSNAPCPPYAISGGLRVSWERRWQHKLLHGTMAAWTRSN